MVRVLVTMIAWSALTAGWSTQETLEGTGWLPEWADQLGITLEKVPAPDEPFSTLKGTVKNPETAAKLLGSVKEGTELTLSFAGNVSWTVELEGKTVRPATVKVRVAGRSEELTLVPDRRTRQLRPAPPPFRGSRRLTGGGGN
ncbi:MAG: hypothetical protein Kow00109_07780 [Acidobacteriota bacterium]